MVDKNIRARSEWYQPIGEFFVACADLEFSLLSWIRSLSHSTAIANMANNQSFAKNVSLVLDLVTESYASPQQKEKWRSLWVQAKAIFRHRNTIAHNGPIENFEFEPAYIKQWEVIRLNKPIGRVGDGLSIEDLREQIAKASELYDQLDECEDEIIVHFRNKEKE